MLQLLSIQDPRDDLEKARRLELERFAEANGVTEIVPGMPAVLMRNILRQKGLTRISIPVRTLGQTIQPGTSPVAQPEQKVDTVNATDDLMRQWATQTPQAPQKPRNEIVELRKECKQRGIKMARTDKIADLRAKLDGTHAS